MSSKKAIVRNEVLTYGKIDDSCMSKLSQDDLIEYKTALATMVQSHKSFLAMHQEIINKYGGS